MTKITIFTNDLYSAVPRPEWWDEALQELWSGPDGEPVRAAIEGLGKHLRDVSVYDLSEQGVPEQRGWVAYLGNGFETQVVWLPEQADLLNFLSIAVPRWMGLREFNHQAEAESLERIMNTLIGFARHGEGEHISLHGNRNHRDENLLRQEARALADRHKRRVGER